MIFEVSSICYGWPPQKKRPVQLQRGLWRAVTANYRNRCRSFWNDQGWGRCDWGGLNTPYVLLPIIFIFFRKNPSQVPLLTKYGSGSVAWELVHCCTRVPLLEWAETRWSRQRAKDHLDGQLTTWEWPFQDRFYHVLLWKLVKWGQN